MYCKCGERTCQIQDKSSLLLKLKYMYSKVPAFRPKNRQTFSASKDTRQTRRIIDPLSILAPKSFQNSLLVLYIYSTCCLTRDNINESSSHEVLTTNNPSIMAGASDKARFYLEQSIPELQELERKKLFTKVIRIEISEIAPLIEA